MTNNDFDEFFNLAETFEPDCLFPFNASDDQLALDDQSDPFQPHHESVHPIPLIHSRLGSPELTPD